MRQLVDPRTSRKQRIFSCQKPPKVLHQATRGQSKFKQSNTPHRRRLGDGRWTRYTAKCPRRRSWCCKFRGTRFSMHTRKHTADPTRPSVSCKSTIRTFHDQVKTTCPRPTNDFSPYRKPMLLQQFESRKRIPENRTTTEFLAKCPLWTHVQYNLRRLMFTRFLQLTSLTWALT